jgi:hypothetical protein
MPLWFLAPVALAVWISLWALFAWAARDWSWLIMYGAVTFLALALPVALLGSYERWQVERGLFDPVPSRATKTVNLACGLYATLVGAVILPLVLLLAYLTWASTTSGVSAAPVYFGVVTLAVVSEPVALLVYYQRWQARNGLQ